jgi:hypothetical protein
MARQNAAYVAVNAGEIGPEVMARTSLETYTHTASLLENWLPEVAGPTTFRPGLAFLGEQAKFTWLRRFTFNPLQSYLMLLSDKELRVALSNGEIVKRDAVGCAIVNGNFASLAGWTQTTVANVPSPLLPYVLGYTGSWSDFIAGVGDNGGGADGSGSGGAADSGE